MYPQLAQTAEVTLLESFLTNQSWWGQQKLDGNRFLMGSTDRAYPPSFTTRSGSPYTKKIPKALTDYRFPDGEWILDGELVGDTYWVFDLPKSPITGIHLPMVERHAALSAFIGLAGGPIRLVPTAKTRLDKIRLAEKALAQNYEGLIFKRSDSHYTPGGRNTDWLKLKFTKTVDCFVVPKKKEDGHDSVALGVYDADGNEVEIGRTSAIGKGDITVGDVIEVRYLYVGAQGRLYQPTIMRKRWDKDKPQCTIDQLVHVNKTVLEEIA